MNHMLEFIQKILSLFRKKKVDLVNYPELGIDYGTLTPAQRTSMDNILMACEAGAAATEIPVLTQEEFDEVIFQIGLYFGNEDICKNIALKRQNTALVNLSKYQQAAEHKAELDAWIDNAISQLNEGTAEYKLKEIAKCIARNSRYKCPSNNPLDLLDKGGMCGAYSMMFYKMATRIGVKAFICHGDADTIFYSGLHAWNKVELDGVSYFYDVTFYDTFPPQYKYIHSKTPWGRQER